MSNLPPFHEQYWSTRKLREIRTAGLIKIAEFKEPRYCLISSATIHIFPDCIMVYGQYKMGHLSLKPEDNYNVEKIYKVFTRDLKTWDKYEDQFEPKDGHRGFKYEPHDTPFPTKIF